jgi:hypothetical protein
MNVQGCSLIAQAHNTRINSVNEFTEATMEIRLKTEKRFTMKKLTLLVMKISAGSSSMIFFFFTGSTAPLVPGLCFSVSWSFYRR